MASTNAPVYFFIAPDGSDRWSGRMAEPDAKGGDGPLATLAGARDAVRRLKKAGPLPSGGVMVVLAGGTYFLDRGVELGAEDSGTAEAPVVYSAAPGQQVCLVGGREIGGFKPVTDPAVLARLPEQARRHVLHADLKDQGVSDYGTLASRGFARHVTPSHLELFFNDKPMTVARWPNEGFVTIAGIPESSAQDDGHGGKIGDLKAGFLYEGDRPAAWQQPQEAWVHGYWAWDWANSYEQIESLDARQRLIKTRPPYGQYGFRIGQRIFFLNILEELDSPGEFYVDRAKGLLYFWPPQEIRPGSVRVSVMAEPVFRLQDASFVTIQGLTMECLRGTAIDISGGRGCLVTGCTVRNVGNWAAKIEGGSDHAFRGCSVYQTGDGGVNISGGDRATLKPCGHVVEDCRFHDIGRWSKCYVPAVLAGGVGIAIRHNLIHDHPHCAVLFNGNEHVIEYNEIHHVCLETGDVGAIYTGRDWTYRGNVIRFNYIHHTGGVGMGSMGVYMDDCVSGTLIFGNVFHQVQRAAFLGGGRDFRVENNIFVDCNPAVQMDGRGLNKSKVWHDMVYVYMKEQMEKMNWRQPPYATRYPELAALEKYYQSDTGVPPENSVVLHNICWRGKWVDVHWGATPDMLKVQDNLVNVDPHFVDEAGENFQLRDDSPAYKVGFQRIDVSRIGPR